VIVRCMAARCGPVQPTRLAARGASSSRWLMNINKVHECNSLVHFQNMKYAPEGTGRPNLISWRWSLPLPTDPVCWRSMHAISSYRGNRSTKATNAARPLQTGPI